MAHALPEDGNIATDPPSSAPSLEQSIHCFRTAGRPRHSRARLTAGEREKVLGVRRQGACLRCRILKIECSLENPCHPCLQSAVRGSERRVLSFCYCVRTRFADVNIFVNSSSHVGEGAAAVMQTETLLRTLSDLLTRVAAPANFSLTSNPTVFNNTMLSWLTNPNFHLPNGSVVGLCCSSLLRLQLQQEEGGGEGIAAGSADSLVTDFRRFLLATSLAHAGWRDSSGTISSQELRAAGQVAGWCLIKRLDRALTPQYLASCGPESCQVLFLLVLGAILGVGYSSSQLEDHSPQFPVAELLSPQFHRSPTLWLAMKEHLCQMLAHHLIFIGSMLGIRLETGLEQRIIDTAVKRWNKTDGFVWADVVGLGQQNQSGPPSMSAELPADVKKKDSDVTPRNQGAIRRSPRPPHSEPPLLVPIRCREANGFQPRTTDNWSENPKSYLSMFDEPEAGGPSDVNETQEETLFSKMNLEAQCEQQEHARPQERRRRSIWIVRPFDAGAGHVVNLHARLRGGRNNDSLRAFL